MVTPIETSYTEQLVAQSPRIGRTSFGRRLLAATYGLQMDAELYLQKLVSQDQIPGSGQLLGAEQIMLDERGFQRYHNDDVFSMRARDQHAWAQWQNIANVGETGDCLRMVERQLDIAGYPNSKCISQGLHGTSTYPVSEYNNGNANPYDITFYPPSSEYWSQFIVVVPTDGTRWCQWPIWEQWDQPGITWDQPYVLWDMKHSNFLAPELLVEIQSIVQQFKPVDWICREIVLLNYVASISWNAGAYASDPESVLDDSVVVVFNKERWVDTL